DFTSFFFSSRRRHTISKRDWSSDVCSSDLRESIKYVAINVVSSSLFLIAIAYLYGSIGTLNMAHVSERVAETGQTPILTVISFVFLLVFSIKSGLLLYQW